MASRKVSLPLTQVLMPPFRAETGVPPAALPVYAAITPPVPPYALYRPVAVYPANLSLAQLQILLEPGPQRQAEGGSPWRGRPPAKT